MNIFKLHECPVVSAKMACDQHVCKMRVESAQMLSEAQLLASSNPHPNLYTPFNPKHGCSLWVRESAANYRWLYRHFRALCAEYIYRYAGDCEILKMSPIFHTTPDLLPNIGLTPFYQAMPEQYKAECSTTAYRLYYNGEKLFARWTRRKPPDWWEHDKTTHRDSLRQKRLKEQRMDFNISVKARSSNIAEIRYNTDTSELGVKFHSGKRYIYSDVSWSELHDFITADSQGNWFSKNIRNKKEFRQLE